MAVETFDPAYGWLADVTGVSASDLNNIWTPEILATVFGDIIYDHTLGKVGSALVNLLTGAALSIGAIAAKEHISPRDRTWLHELGSHFLTRVFRLGSPGEFALALREARSMGLAFGEKRYQDALRMLVKTPEAMSFSLDEVKRAWEELTAPLPAAPPEVPPVTPVPPVYSPPAVVY